MSFGAIVAAAEPLAEGFRAAIPPDWHQGRTSYGGLSSTLALEAALRVGGELPPLRSAQVSMIGPLAGDIEVSARVLRRGRNATWLAAEINCDGRIGLTATFVFMSEVASSLTLGGQPPPEALIDPDTATPLADDRGATFLRHHFDVRFALPRNSQKPPEMCWWVRPRERSGLAPVSEVLLTADALPPGLMPLIDPRVPVSTMQWQISLLTPAPATDDWWLLRSVADAAGRGNASQRMAVWNRAGDPIAVGQQSIALFG